MPSPSWEECYRRQGYYDLIFSAPEILLGLIFTFAGLGVAPMLRRRIRPLAARPFWGTAIVTLTVLVILALVSDMGGHLGFGCFPIFLLHGWDLLTAWAVVKLFLGASILSGVVEKSKEWSAS